MNTNEAQDFEILSKIIRQRRSIFPVQYSDEPISQDFIDQMLELSNWAPTHRRTEPWRYVVISGEARSRLGSFLSLKYEEITPTEKYSPLKQAKIHKKCMQSQYVILICMQRDVMERVPEWEEIASVAMSVQNMWLACSSKGVGCYWSSPGMIQYMDEFLPLNQGEKCLGLFYIGSTSIDWPAGMREAMVDKVRYVTI